MLRRGSGGILFDRPIVTDHGRAKRRQHRAAARLATALGGDQWLLERLVETLDQQPRAAIRHLHGTAGGCDRTVLADQFEEPDLAWADRAERPQFDAHVESGGGRGAL